MLGYKLTITTSTYQLVNSAVRRMSQIISDGSSFRDDLGNLTQDVSESSFEELFYAILQTELLEMSCVRFSGGGMPFTND